MRADDDQPLPRGGHRARLRRAEAIAILERLSFEHRLPPWSYASVLRDHGALVADELRVLRAIVG